MGQIGSAWADPAYPGTVGKWGAPFSTPLAVINRSRPRGKRPGQAAGRQSAGFQMMAKASSSSCPAARPRLA